MKRRALLLAAISLALVLGTGDSSWAQLTNCGWTQPCYQTSNPNCVPAPTSLRPWMADDFNPIFQQPTVGNCGSETCFIFFKCACGAPLASKTCNQESDI